MVLDKYKYNSIIKNIIIIKKDFIKKLTKINIYK